MKKFYVCPTGRMWTVIKLMLVFVVLVMGEKSWGQTIVTVGGGSTIACPATPTATWTTPPTGVSYSNWSRGSGVTCSSFATALSGSGFNTVNAAASYSANKFYSVTLTAAATHNFVLNSVTWLTSLSSGTAANFDVQYSNNGGAITTFGTTGTSISSNTYNGNVSVLAGTSIILYLIPSGGALASGTTVRCANGSTITVTSSLACSPPPNPSGTIVGTTPACSSTSLSYSSPSTTSYWQTSATGTSTAQNTITPYIVSSSNTYYIREYNGTCWSTGAVASSPIIINVQPSSPSAPASVSVGEGSNAAFTATASGAASYIWEVNTGSGYSAISNGGIYSTATTSILNLTAVPLSYSGYLYRAIAVGSSPCVNSAASTPATLSVTPVSAASDYFRSNSVNTGTGGSWATTSNWQSSTDNITWITASLVPSSSANIITIRNGHNIDISSGSQSVDQLIIDAGASLRFSGGTFSLADGTGVDMSVNGTFNRTSANTFNQLGQISFNSASTYNHAINAGAIPTATWNISSTCTVTGMTGTQPLLLSFGQVFGIFNWNCSAQSTFAIIGANAAFNPKGLMSVLNTGTSVIELESAGAGSTYNIDGGLTISGGTFSANYDNAGTTLEVTVNIAGNLILSGSGIFDLQQGNGSATTSGYGATINLTGDINLGSSVNYSLTTSGNNNYGRINFTGGTIQNYFRTSGLASQYVDYVIPVGKSLSLQNSLQLFSASTTAYDLINVDGVIDMGTNTIIQSSGTAAKFTVTASGTIITANTGGLVAAISVGGTKTFTAGASYIFNGATTTPFPTGTFGSPGNLTFNAVVVSNRSSSMTINGAININANAGYTLNPTTNNLSLGGIMTISATGFFDNGGENQIQNGGGSIIINGKFITRDVDGFNGTNTAVPSVPITFAIESTVEFGGNNQIYQPLTTGNITGLPTYIIFSGSGTKTGDNISTLNAGLITIKNGVSVNAVSGASFGNVGTALTMEALSKLSVAGSGTQPNMSGTYTLDPTSTIEFAGTVISIVRLSPIYAQVIVSGTNISNTSIVSGIKFQAGASFTVKSGATFRLNNPNGFSNTTGGGTTSISNISPSNPTITLEPNSTIDYAGDEQIITNAAVSSPSTGNYYNLTLSGSGIKTAPGTSLTLLGNFYRNGTHTFNANAGKLIFASTTSAQKYFANTGVTDIDFYDVTNSNTYPSGLSVDATMGILHELDLGAVNKILLNTGDVILRSKTGANATANIPSLGITGTGVTATNITYNTGRFVVERYLFAQKSWRFLSVPLLKLADDNMSPTINDSWREGGTTLASTGYGTRITGPGITALPGGVDEYTQRNSMKYFDMSVNNYSEITSADIAANKTIANDEGYYVFVRGDRGINIAGGATGETTLRARGKIRTGDQSYYVNANSFQSVGNPFPSRIKFLDVVKTSVEDAFIAWNPANTAGGYGVGRFQQYANMSNSYSGAFGPKDYIESGEAFFISSTSIGSITIQEAAKTSGSSNLSRAGVRSPTLEINLFAKATDNLDYKADGTFLNFDPQFNNTVNNDDVKKFSNSTDNLAILKNNVKLFAERRTPLQITDTIFLSLTNTRVAAYRFEIDPSVLGNLPLNGFLQDRFLQTETSVSLIAVTNVNFNITTDVASRAADRFMIVFRTGGSAGPLPFSFISINAENNADKTNTIKWTCANETNMNNFSVERSLDNNIFTTSGNILTTGSGSYMFVDAAPVNDINYYRIKANAANGQAQYSAVVKIANSKQASFAVQPNPVVNKTLHINFENMQGNHNIKLVAKNGVTVYTRMFVVSSVTEIKRFEVNGVAAGIYEIVIINSNGKQLTETIFIK